MTLSGKQARAARALIELSREQVAKRAGLTVEALAAFEVGGPLGEEERTRLRGALEEGGAVFVAADAHGGPGVRLKFNALEVRAIHRMEGEGGPVREDDV